MGASRSIGGAIGGDMKPKPLMIGLGVAILLLAYLILTATTPTPEPTPTPRRAAPPPTPSPEPVRNLVTDVIKRGMERRVATQPILPEGNRRVAERRVN
jgi:hypothetical protein